MGTPDNVQPIRSARRKVGQGGVVKLLRISHPDYGTGHITADLGHGVQIYWDTPYTAGLAVHLLLHDRSWVESQCERIE